MCNFIIIVSQVKTSYYKLSKKFHPDLNKERGEEQALKFRELSEAYEILGNDEKRRSYDVQMGYHGTRPVRANLENYKEYHGKHFYKKTHRPKPKRSSPIYYKDDKFYRSWEEIKQHDAYVDYTHNLKMHDKLNKERKFHKKQLAHLVLFFFSMCLFIQASFSKRFDSPRTQG